MRGCMLLTLAILCLAQYYVSGSRTTNVICYHGTWAYYRKGNGSFTFNNIPANLCTHYVYAFAGLKESTNEIVELDPWLDENLGGLKAAAHLKTINPNIKVFIGIGGWNEGSRKFSKMVSSPETRAKFIASVVKFIQAHNFDGCDLDWEYPARRDSENPSQDKINFFYLVKEFYEAFNPLGLLVGAAVSATPSTVDISYNVSALSQYLNHINVMTYDFHGAFDNFTGHNSPLYSAARFDNTEYADYSINASILGWLKRGAHPIKLALGIPFYGRTNVLSDIKKHKPGDPAKAIGGPPGPYTATAGLLGYNEFVESSKSNNWTQAWDDEQKVPYAYLNDTWLSFENVDSIKLKVEYAKNLGLGGVLIWSIETEDFLGINGTTYPLLKAINAAMGRNITTS